MSETNVPDYLGRVLAGNGGPIGTCFHVGGAIFVTAKHVVRDAALLNSTGAVTVDHLGSPDIAPQAVTVLAEGATSDLALLKGSTSFESTIGRIRLSSSVQIDELVQIHGHSDLPDRPGRPRPRFFHASGTWRGVILREDDSTVAAIASGEVLKGMSGAPVCDRLGRVVGVISGRYNTMDGWAAGTVWVATAEDLVSLLDGVIDVPGKQMMTKEDYAIAVSGPAAVTALIALDQLRRHIPPGDPPNDEVLVWPTHFPSTPATPPQPSEDPTDGPLATLGRWIWDTIDDFFS